jgi:DnaJ-class molecular chaperone
VSSKKDICKVCGGKGKLFLCHNGTVINSDKCPRCRGTGRVQKQK